MSQGNSKNRRNYNVKNKSKINIGDKGKEVLENLDENNPIIKQFQEYAKELDTKHDRFERLVKISRDITIESKRIIFLLHTLDKESKKNEILKEAESRLNNLTQVLLKKIAEELDGEDHYLYLRAFRAGLQEFIEAITFYWYLHSNILYSWTDISKSMTYAADSNQTDSNVTEKDQVVGNENIIHTLLPAVEYVLGIADLTGELMRKCINNLASGDISSCFQTCNFVRSMYKEFLGSLGVSGREVSRKLFTLKQSLIKMENVCYAIKVRGSEIPKHMLADVAIIATENMTVEDDEGYQIY